MLTARQIVLKLLERMILVLFDTGQEPQTEAVQPVQHSDWYNWSDIQNPGWNPFCSFCCDLFPFFLLGPFFCTKECLVERITLFVSEKQWSPGVWSCCCDSNVRKDLAGKESQIWMPFCSEKHNCDRRPPFWFQQACLTLDVDIISLDLTSKLPFHLKRQQINSVRLVAASLEECGCLSRPPAYLVVV